jgi:hypothetical protein
MGHKSRLSLKHGLLTVVAIVLALQLPLAAPAEASGNYVPSHQGIDISWPQCDGGYPTLLPDQFGIVGVNAGRPDTQNPCFSDEYDWASAGGRKPSVYMNLEYGQRSDGPRWCVDGDTSCLAYDYGWVAASDADHRVIDATGGSSLKSVTMWWLDIETENDWAECCQYLNIAVIQGAIDYFQEQGRPVGIYSTSYQFAMITGGTYGPQGVPSWVAGAVNETDTGKCAEPLWGTSPVWMFQYLTADYDENWSC